MTTQYNINAFVHGVNGFGLQFSDTVYSATLPASTDKTLTVPGASALGTVNASVTPKYIAIFSYQDGRKVYVALNQTAEIPGGGDFAATTSELNPNAKLVKAGDVIHMYTPTADTDVSVAFYAIQE